MFTSSTQPMLTKQADRYYAVLRPLAVEIGRAGLNPNSFTS